MIGIPANIRVFAALSGPPLSEDRLKAWGCSCHYIAAADGGATSLLAAGLVPHLVVGDMDSFDGKLPSETELLKYDNQDTTDVDKLLQALAVKGFQSVTLANVDGGLPDHQLATYHSAAKSRLLCRFVFETGIGYVLRGPVSATYSTSGRVSLLPLSECTGVNLSGVRWPIENQTLSPLGFSSISNQATDSEISVEIASGAAFLFLAGPIDPSWD